MAAPPHQPVGDASAVDPSTLGPASFQEAWRWLLAAGLGYVGGTALALVFTSVGVAIAGTKGGVQHLAAESSPPVWYLVLSFAGLWTGFGGSAWAVTRRGRRVGLRFERSDIWYVFLGFALQLALIAVYAHVHEHGLSRPEHLLLGGASGWLYVVPAALTVFGAPLFEELFFRGTLLRGLLGVLQHWPRAVAAAVAVVLDGTVFGLLHLGTDPWVELPGLAGVGVVLAIVAVRSGRLGPSIVTHAAFNAVTVFAFWATR